MEKCKYCEAELEEGNALCPACGKDNTPVSGEEPEQTPLETAEAPEQAAPAAAEETEPAAREKKAAPAGKKFSGKLVFAVVALVLLAAVLTALVMSGLDQAAAPGLELSAQTEQSQVTATTIPDGNPEDQTCKGSYTASDKQVLKNADTVVATAGEHQLTLGQLQIYYWQEIGGWLSQYGSYASYFGLDPTQPLDTQLCGVMEGNTWQQFFLASALNSWRTYVALDSEAEKAGYAIDPTYSEYLLTLEEQMEQEAVAGGFESAQALMEYNVGVGASLEDYAQFLEIYYHGYSYYNHFYTTATASEEEVEAMFALHEAEYAQNGLTKETKSVDVRHILILPEGATSDSVFSQEFPEEAWTAAEEQANALLQQWLDGEQTEEAFAALATEHNQDPGSAANGGLYTDVYQGTMVETFDAWCFDPARQPGDTGVVETEYGYHVMYYVSDTLLWKDLVAEDVISEKTNAMVDTAVDSLPITVDYSLIQLGLAERFYSAPEQTASASAASVYWISVAAVSAVCIAVVLLAVKKRKKNTEE